MERTANIDLAWRTDAAPSVARSQLSVRAFAGILIACACLSALFASWLPLQVSVVTVFLFAGPHNWFELRYFLMRLPVRFGKSRNFFFTAFAGIAFLTLTYISLPVLYSLDIWPDNAWPTILATWNTLLLFWLALLVRLRGNQKLKRDWSWTIPVALGLCSLNWLAPEFFSLAIVYLHPLVALWFLDRHLARTRPNWLRAYRRSLCLLPLLLMGMVWQLARTPALADDNGLFWRITQHAGAQLLPGVSSQVLVAVHVFLEMLHYAVWLVALPLIGSAGSLRSAVAPQTHSDTPVLHSDTPVLHPDTPVLHSDTPVLHPDTPVLHSDRPVLHSDTPVLHFDAPVLHFDAPVLRSDRPVLHSGIRVLHSAIPAETTGLIEGSTDLTRRERSVELNEGRRSAEPAAREHKAGRIWDVKSVPLACHPRGFPRLVATALVLGVFLVAVLWFGFSVDYSTTRDVYFTVAIAHVLAEAPFLLKML